ncbi:hypothetical protein [Cytobacillus horneckiae]|uniref:Lipoprotein n=1 Tax=Cytobacillus horneckiae TaxID=549687 RepID=A0A2N0ZMB1_9BACI|nr:hypothetical protein [Cytobacillus horneckiae]MEC1155020.1 hypothetical protein [Cytobacillus horneckiae]MED2936074.1 hypothetical protein [Cytobacillus horneckiae]PKG30654.1 hypothetical protein CWS20_01845 [Cytobacillus horneckiae]
MRSLLLGFICSFFLIACSSNELNSNPESINTEEKLKNELVQLFKEKRYDEIMDKVVKQETELQENFFNIVLAYKELEKVEGVKLSSWHISTFKSIKTNFEKVTNPPEEIAEEIDRTKKLTEQKYTTLLLEEEPTKTNVNISNLPLPSIGMTAEEVIYSQWGKPIDINRTTTATQVSEQWVYPNYKYLYFEDGILVTIQD